MNVFDLHFLRPEWLWLLPVHILLAWLLMRSSVTTPWEGHLPKAALEVLSIGHTSKNRFQRWWLLLCGLGLIVAAAGPSWVKKPTPALSNQSATVILLDLSPSMLSTDIKPNRITRARFELIDILDQQRDGQTGLIAYGASAHIVSPLTDDADTIKALIPALSPTVIPEPGSNVEAAVELAQQLLSDAGAGGGKLILITDGVTESAKNQILRQLKSSNSLSILAVGGNELTPIPGANGGFVKDQGGEIVLTQLDFGRLNELASKAGGVASRLFADAKDTERLTGAVTGGSPFNSSNSSADQNTNTNTNDYDQWQDMGYLFILLTLPWLLALFRKGAVYLVAVFIFLPIPESALAQSSFSLNDVFTTKDQQAAKLMQQGKHAEAAATFKDGDWSAAANYKAKQYQATISNLEGKTDVTSLYNKANAQAFSGDLEAAINTYDAVLEQQASHEDAAHNKALLEQLLEQQNQQQNQQESQQQEQDGQQGDDQQQEENGQSDSSQQQNSENQQGSDEEPSADQKPSADKEPSAEKEPSADEKPSANKESSSDQDSSEDTKSLSQQSEQQKQDAPEPQEGKSKAESNPESAPEEETPTDTQAQQTPPNDTANQTTDDTETFVQAQQESNAQALSDSSEQWLRSINEDPAGLLRRKFEYQAWQREQQRQQQGSRNGASQGFGPGNQSSGNQKPDSQKQEQRY